MPGPLTQRTRVLTALSPRDITALATGPYQDVSGAQRVLTAITTATLAATKTVTVQLMQATDANGANAKTLGAPVTLTGPGGGAAMSTTVDAKIGDLDHNANFGFVAVQLSSNNATALYAAALLILGSNRYNP